MPGPALQLCYHDHCFDGVASSATFLRFYRDQVRPVRDVGFQGLAHKAGALFGEDVFRGEVNAVVDFRFSQDPRLTWWFDHHQSAFETPADQVAFESDQSGRKFWDPRAKSCTRFLARVASEKFGWDATPLAELIHWAEIIDGALFESPLQAVSLAEPALQLMMLIEASKDAALGPRLIEELSVRPLSSVLREPWVTEPLAPLLARHHELVRLVTARIQLSFGVATYDLVDLGVDSINKFIAYAADAATLYTVSVSRGANRSKISLGSNPWRQADRRHNLAQIAERFGGGGHPPVAAISFRPDELERAREVARGIAEELRER